MYFNQLSGAACTRKLVKLLIFQLFSSFFDIVEELFEDVASSSGNPETDETNRTGNYIARVKLSRVQNGKKYLQRL